MSNLNWWSETITYSGLGRAEFKEPHGFLAGPTDISFDEFGRQSIEMSAEELECDRSLVFGVSDFLSGRSAHKSTTRLPGSTETRERFLLTMGTFDNRGLKLTVDCDEGKFSAEGRIVYSPKTITDQLPADIRFHPVRSYWDSNNEQQPTCWVLPLQNFVSDFGDTDARLHDHSLRTADRLIVFDFKGRPVFIQPLTDYASRVASLESGQRNKTVTAAISVRIGAEDISPEEFQKWFPFELLGLLSFATGVVVGAPWIEFYDMGGTLIRRLHTSLGMPSFAEGHRTIHETLHHGTGRFLTNALRSVNFDKGSVHAAVKHLVKAGAYEDTTVEDKLTHLARALDCICAELGLTGFNLLKQLKQPKDRGPVKDALNQAKASINALADAAISRGDQESEAILRNIANRTTSNPAYSVHNFGAAVRSLVNHFQLKDCDVLDKHYAANPRADGNSWDEHLSNLRGTAIHQSYLDFDGGSHDIWDVWNIIKHLHDIVTRVVFKSLDYDRTYSTIVSEWKTAVPVDWVTIDTTPDKLGYK